MRVRWMDVVMEGSWSTEMAMYPKCVWKGFVSTSSFGTWRWVFFFFFIWHSRYSGGWLGCVTRQFARSFCVIFFLLSILYFNYLFFNYLFRLDSLMLNANLSHSFDFIYSRDTNKGLITYTWIYEYTIRYKPTYTYKKNSKTHTTPPSFSKWKSLFFYLETYRPTLNRRDTGRTFGWVLRFRTSARGGAAQCEAGGGGEHTTEGAMVLPEGFH